MKKAYLEKRSDPGYIFKRILLKTIRRMITQKSARCSAYCDYTADQFRLHIETLFKPGMSWGNYGLWHVDHRRALSKFTFINPDGSENLEQIKAANSLSNLQPLWAIENLKKGKKEIA